MRYLTIKRKKRFVACFAKIQVYVENPDQGRVMINNVPCSKLGTIKNGEQKTFVIPEYAVKIYVIADRLSKGFCNEYYQLPPGNANVYLEGQNELNPAAGNAFRFFNNPSAGIAQNRKKSTRKGIVVLCICMLAGMLIGGLSSAAALGMFQKDSGMQELTCRDMTITVPGDFRPYDVDQFPDAYANSSCMFILIEDSFSKWAGAEALTVEEYAQLVVESNGGAMQLQEQNGVLWLEHNYTDPATGDAYYYYSYPYKEDDAFWLLQFCVEAKSAQQMQPQIAQWVSTVEFN